MSGWLPEAAELDAYEGLRQGDETAFLALAEPLHPTLRRLARLYVDTEASADDVALRTWVVALRGLEGFRWHTPLATWIAKITVALGRTRDLRTQAPSPRPITPAAPHAVPGPPDWSDLPWGPRWDHAGATLAAALAALPVDQREVVHGRDVEQWPRRRVCDVFGLPEVTYERLLAEARTALRDALAPLVGQPDPGRHGAAQLAAVTAWLNARLEHRPEPLDPPTVAVFRRWRRARRATWHQLGHPFRRGTG